MKKEFKIICTIGPNSNSPEILEKLADRGVNFFRINLSHTPEEEIEARIKDLLGYKIPIILDTEGSQVRSGNINEIHFEEGSIVKLFFNPISCNKNNLFLNPPGVVKKLEEGDLISIDFDSLMLRVYNVTTHDEGYILCKVAIGGSIGGRKAVQIDSPNLNLPPFSKKDHLALNFGKKYGVNHFTLSFMESPEHVKRFREVYPEAILYSKIESKKGLENYLEIAKVSDGILLDRGDLSSQIPLEKIPLIQKLITKRVGELGKEVFIATNTLEQMAFSLKPSKAEVNDIINTLLDGASGIALTKETAVGKYPIETVNILKNLISQVEILGISENLDLFEKLDSLNYNLSGDVPELVIKPHGGKIVNRFFPKLKIENITKSLEINEETLMDLEQIAIGAFSPLEGFMSKFELESVANSMKLPNGIIWPLPIVLQVTGEDKNRFFENEDILLNYNGETYGILHLSEIYTIDKTDIAEKVYGTSSREHPGVKRFVEAGDYFLAGKVTLFKRRTSPLKVHELTPNQTRRIFTERGWSKVVGFHTRNVIHKSHEFIQLEGMKKGLCDGLFVHPVIGKKKPGDFESPLIIRTYEKMIEEFYPESKVVFGTFATYSRYCGPREALFTALVRKNFGCSHFIVGRDHTGVGDFYDPHAPHKIFSKFSKEELGITPILFDKVFYSEVYGGHIHEREYLDHPEEHKLHISGTQAREIFKSGKQPPSWFMRPEISQIILDAFENNENIFVSHKKTKILWLTGLSGSGKSTITKRIIEKLKKKNKTFLVLDGDYIRKNINKHLKFTPDDIKENNRIIINLCSKKSGNVDYILVPVISPFKESRIKAREIFKENFVEIFVNCSYDECKKRDTKGLYLQAESGQLENFIGLHVPYEEPENPEIILNTSIESPEESTLKVLDYLSIK